MNVETATRLVTLRKRAGLSQEELADRIGVSRQAVSKWERAESSPDTDNLIALAKTYGVRVDDMLNADIAPDGEIRGGTSDGETHFNWAAFPYPVIVTIVFFLLIFDVIPGNFPAWLVFLTIPIWGFFFTKGKNNKDKQEKKQEKQQGYDDWMND
ncbi:MAG: helix-turn-helix transcriptional regulator [Eubacteriales bacterium]